MLSCEWVSTDRCCVRLEWGETSDLSTWTNNESFFLMQFYITPSMHG